MIAKQKILKKLNQRNIRYNIYSHDDIPTVEIAMKKVDFDIDHCMKTIAFEYGDKFIFVCTLAKKQIDYSKLCHQLNINRSKLKKANSLILENKFGYEDGGISPISISKEIIVVIDNCLNRNDIVFCGSGLRNETIEIQYGDLLSLDNVILNNISR